MIRALFVVGVLLGPPAGATSSCTTTPPAPTVTMNPRQLAPPPAVAPNTPPAPPFDPTPER